MKQGIELSAGDQLAGYTIIRELGRGNNGVVYLARQNVLERQVACKVLLPETASDPGYVEAFFREARNAAKLSHPNIVQALDVGEENGLNYFIMEYVDGEMLETIRVKNPERFTPLFMLRIAVQLADALDYAWKQHKMIHGDIKPENIMLQHSGGIAKLADLGVARVAGTQSDDSLMATPLYVAPEVILGNGGADPRNDIYSFGVMLYELFCGYPPFTGTAHELIQKHVSEYPLPLIQAAPDLDRELAEFIDRMLAKLPENRPQSWQEIRDVLQKILEREKIRSTIKAQPLKNWSNKPKFKLPQWLNMLIAIGLSGLIAYLLIRICRMMQ